MKKVAGLLKKANVFFAAMFLLTQVNIPMPVTWAATGDRFERGPFLNIGIPDGPRRVKRELPEASKFERVKAGPLLLHPLFTEETAYESNILLSHEDPKDDVTFTERPGIVAEMQLGNHRIEGGYGMEIVNFVKDHEENAVNHLANLEAELNFNDFQLSASDAFEKSTSRVFSETSARDELILNTTQVKARYDRPRWASELGWTHNLVMHNVPDLDTNDYNEDIAAFLAGYKILPKTLLLGEFDWGTVYYGTNDDNPDQNYWQLLGGLRGEPTKYFETTTKVGFQGRRLEDVPGEGRQTDFYGLVVNADMVYRPTDTDSINAGYVRTIRTSTFQLSGWYREDQIFASYRRQIAKNWYVGPQISWQLNDYPEGATVGGETRRRDDHFWVTNIGLQYKIREWIWAGLKYNFQARDSNFDTFDYTNNRVSVDLSVRY